MKSILLVVLFFLSLAFAQQTGLPSAWWAGSTAGVNTTWWEPAFSDNSCTNTTTNSSFIVLNVSFNTTGVRQILAMGDSSASYITVFVYNGTLNASEPCNNLQQQLIKTTSYYSDGPQIDDFVYFQANKNYSLVVSTPATDGGQFALNVFDSIANGTTSGQPTWDAVYLNPDCETDETAPYAVFTWTQSTTGLYEVVAGFTVNYTAGIYENSGYTYLAVFQGSLTSEQIQNDDICSTSAVILNAFYEDWRGTRLYGLSLVAGQNYTAVFSGDSASDFSNYGFFVYPSRLRVANFLATGFTQPYNNSLTGCEDSSFGTNNSWAAVSYPAPFSNALVSTASFYSSSQLSGNWTTLYASYIYVYTGNNLGSSTTAPSTCTGYYDGDDSGPYGILTTPGQNYTVVGSYYSEGPGYPSSGDGVFLFFLMTGNTVGSISVHVPTTGGSGAATGGSGAATSGSGIATGTHSTIGNTTSTTSAASVLVSSPFVFVLVAFFFALMF